MFRCDILIYFVVFLEESVLSAAAKIEDDRPFPVQKHPTLRYRGSDVDDKEGKASQELHRMLKIVLFWRTS